MPLPVYYVQHHQGHWRIRYEGRYFGEYETAEAAAGLATLLAKSHLVPDLPTRVVIEKDGQSLTWEPET